MTLAQTAIFTKRAILGFIFISLIGMITFTGYNIWYARYLASLPPQEEVPDTLFGVLPSPDLPPTKVLSSSFTYSLDTTTGSLPTFEKITKVYFMPKPTATFLAPEKSQALAEKFNIKTSPQILSSTNYIYQEDSRVLNIDLDSGNFKFTNTATPSAIVDDDKKLIDDFKRTLASLGVLKDELNSDRTNVIKVDPQNVDIYIWPADLDKKSIVTSEFNKSLVSAKLTISAAQLQNYLKLDFTFWPVDQSKFATYPIKTALNAYDELKNGQGIIILEPKRKEVSITSIYLAYFQDENYNPYLQPIFVFEGPGFVAFVIALEPPNIAK